jgi:hypothetical protein
VNLLHLDGCYIGGDLVANEFVVSSSIFAEMSNSFRCRIGGGLQISGASVGGGIEIEGIHVANEIVMITGKCTRLRASCGIWSNDGHAEFAPADIGGILLDSVTVTAGVSLIAARVRTTTNGYAEGVLMRGVRMGGEFSLWSDGSDKRLRKLAGQKGLRVTDAVFTTLQAVIDGDVDLRGLHAGDVHLSGARISGRVCLDNADISGSIRAVDHGLTSIHTAPGTEEHPSFEARNAKVGGDVDLWTLSTSGDIVANGLEARGNVRLLAPRRPAPEAIAALSHQERPAARCGGRIHLEGIAASKLAVTAENIVKEQIGSARDKAAFLLARARLGQLEIQGFRAAALRRLTLPVTCDLSRIEVSDWQLGDWRKDPRREVRALLASTVPFDRNVYITLEERLAKLDYRRAANQTWRRMVWRGSSWWKWPLLLVNQIVSGLGTLPGLLILWFVVSMGPVAGVLWDPRNISFPAQQGIEQNSKVQPQSAATQERDPRDETVKQDKLARWDGLKALGLTVSYAAPVFLNPEGTSRPVARDSGPSCVSGWPQWPDSLWAFVVKHESAPECGSSGNSAVLGLGDQRPTPFTVAYGMALIQRVLWLFVAANLPAIIRRRK